MRLGIKATLSNYNEFSKKLDFIAREMCGNEMFKAFSRGCQAIQGEAKSLAPGVTGELRQSIKVKTENNRGKFSGIVYTNCEYAPYVEMGTGPVGQANHQGISPHVNPTYKQSGWRYPKEISDGKTVWIYTEGQRAQPYLYPAFKYSTTTIRRIMAKEAQKILEDNND